MTVLMLRFSVCRCLFSLARQSSICLFLSSCVATSRSALLADIGETLFGFRNNWRGQLQSRQGVLVLANTAPRSLLVRLAAVLQGVSSECRRTLSPSCPNLSAHRYASCCQIKAKCDDICPQSSTVNWRYQVDDMTSFAIVRVRASVGAHALSNLNVISISLPNSEYQPLLRANPQGLPR